MIHDQMAKAELWHDQIAVAWLRQDDVMTAGKNAEMS